MLAAGMRSNARDIGEVLDAIGECRGSDDEVVEGCERRDRGQSKFPKGRNEKRKKGGEKRGSESFIRRGGQIRFAR
jgi:hypothetical protein